MAYNHTTGDGDRIFAPVFADVWDTHLKKMNGSDVKVYVALLLHTTQHDRTWFMSIDELSEDAGVSRDTARLAKDRLVEAGLFGQSWRYRDEAGDYHLTDTRPPPRMQAKNVYKVNVKATSVDAENQSGEVSRGRKSASIEADNKHLVEADNKQQTITPSPEPPPEPLSPLTPKGEDSASTVKDEPESASKPRKKTRTRHEYTPEFESFWEMWPNHRGQSKFEVSKKFTTALKAADAEVILEGAHRFAADPNLNVDYCPAPTTWLNNRRWEAGPLPSRSNPQAQAHSNDSFGGWLQPTQTNAPELPPSEDLFNSNFIDHQEDY